MAPVGTKRAVIDKVNRDIAAVLAMPDVVEKLKAQGAVPSPSTPEALDAQVRRERDLYTAVLQAAGVAAK
jgi:tripartite-type tricarboxylate transporter receptor subunit TctC